MNFKEMVATSHGSNVLPPLPPDEDYDGDSGWDWEDLESRYAHAVGKWLDTSADARRIQGQLLEMIFSVRPKISFKVNGEGVGGKRRIPKLGWAAYMIHWEYDTERLSAALEPILRRSDLFKAFGLDHSQAWNLTDRGDVARWMFQKFGMSLSGSPTGRYGIEQLQQGVPHHVAMKKYLEGKLTAGRYAAFKTWELSSKLEDDIRKRLEQFFPGQEVELTAPEWGKFEGHGQLMTDGGRRVFTAWTYPSWRFMVRAAR